MDDAVKFHCKLLYGLTGRPGSPRLPSGPSGPGAPVGPGGPGEPCREDKGTSNQFLSRTLVAQRTTNSLLLQEIQLFPSLPSPLWGRGDQLGHLDLHYLADPAHKLSSQDAHSSPHISQHTHISLHYCTSLLPHLSTHTSLRITAHPSLPHLSTHTSLHFTAHLSTHISPHYCTSLNTHLSIHLSTLLHISQHTHLSLPHLSTHISFHFTAPPSLPHPSTHISQRTSLHTHLLHPL